MYRLHSLFLFFKNRLKLKIEKRKIKKNILNSTNIASEFFFFLQPNIPRSFFIDGESQSITFIHDTHPYRFRDNLSRLESNREHLSFDVVLSWVSLPKPNTQREFRLPFCIYRIATHGTLSSSGENLMYAFQPLVRWFRVKMMYISHLTCIFDKNVIVLRIQNVNTHVKYIIFLRVDSKKKKKKNRKILVWKNIELFIY